MTDDINEIIAEGIARHNKILGYECRDCGQQFSVGRDARKHIFSEHDDPMGLEKIMEGDDE